MIFMACGVLDLVFAGHRNAARGQQRGAQDDGADGVLVGRVAGAHVVVGQRAEVVARDKAVQRDRGARGAAQFVRRAIGLHVERVVKLATRRGMSASPTSRTQRGQFVHFDNLHVAAEDDGD